MKKVKSNVKVIALAVAVSAVITGAGYKYSTNASESKSINENTIGLNIEKQDKHKIKVYLSNFKELATALQLSIKIEEGNVKFDENSIKWLIDGEGVQKNFKVNDDNKTIDFFIVSNSPINSEDEKIEICEINVSKDESIIEALIGSNDKGYKVVPNIVDGQGYTYVTYDLNKTISGENIANVSDEILTINTKPTIKFKEEAPVFKNQIIISKGSAFRINDYVEAYDSDGNEILEIKYDGKIDNKNAGTYNITCKATDLYGDTSTLEVSVIVEDAISGEKSEPVITGHDKPLKIIIGKEFDLEEGIQAVDYMGRSLDIVIGGEFSTDKEGTYLITYSATDRFHKTTTVERTLIVEKEKTTSDDQNGNGGSNNGNSGSNNGNSGSNSGSSSSNNGSSSSNSGNNTSGSDDSSSNVGDDTTSSDDNSSNVGDNDSNSNSQTSNGNIGSPNDKNHNEGEGSSLVDNVSNNLTTGTSGNNTGNDKKNDKTSNKNTLKDKVSNIISQREEEVLDEPVEENEENKKLEDEIEKDNNPIEDIKDNLEEKDNKEEVKQEEYSNNILIGAIASLIGIASVAMGLYFKKKK